MMTPVGTEGAMSGNDWVGIITITVTVFALYSSALAWLVGQNGRLRAETKRDLERLEGRQGADASVVRAEVQAGILAIQQQVNQLRDGSATKPELVAVEQRLAFSLNEFKAESRTEFAKIGQKVDRLPAMEANLVAVSRTVEKIGVALSQRV
jgi:hypothetical protein